MYSFLLLSLLHFQDGLLNAGAAASPGELSNRAGTKKPLKNDSDHSDHGNKNITNKSQQLSEDSKTKAVKMKDEVIFFTYFLFQYYFLIIYIFILLLYMFPNFNYLVTLLIWYANDFVYL